MLQCSYKLADQNSFFIMCSPIHVSMYLFKIQIYFVSWQRCAIRCVKVKRYTLAETDRANMSNCLIHVVTYLYSVGPQVVAVRCIGDYVILQRGGQFPQLEKLIVPGRPPATFH